jgi:hypothetical protein
MINAGAHSLYRQKKDAFWYENGQPTGFVINHHFWLELTELFQGFGAVKCEPPPEKCPKWENLNVYRTSDGPNDFIHFF